MKMHHNPNVSVSNVLSLVYEGAVKDLLTRTEAKTTIYDNTGWAKQSIVHISMRSIEAKIVVVSHCALLCFCLFVPTRRLPLYQSIRSASSLE